MSPATVTQGGVCPILWGMAHRRARRLRLLLRFEHEAVPLVQSIRPMLRSFKKDSGSDFVLLGTLPNPATTYDYYRCNCTWRNLHEWLRRKGVRQTKANHALRKESGSFIASHFGIEAARQHLGYRDIRTTSSHYVEKKKRIEVQLPLGRPGTINSIAG
jgi:hypothetical protein